ncbi:hypothetical protein QFC22_005790 [Naganishia vaughanmartiniae]|uniref:Uncharacterized protein n=1 Tax=Naganishia vaughanmartiniae TaxID=1424756 RepID=A0ACC2WRB0_9TREE|nr:hypothetical protein QFC22_005790 [Naganishia vaughanmartiniae]
MKPLRVIAHGEWPCYSYLDAGGLDAYAAVMAGVAASTSKLPAAHQLTQKFLENHLSPSMVEAGPVAEAVASAIAEGRPPKDSGRGGGETADKGQDQAV